MKPCNRCGDLKPDEAYATDRTREDGLALICRECNKEKCREWYRENQAKKRAAALAYKAEHGHSPSTPMAEKRKREIKKREEAKAAEPDDFQLIRFSQSEWLFVLQQAEQLGIEPQLFVRYLVQDARAALVKLTPAQD